MTDVSRSAQLAQVQGARPPVGVVRPLSVTTWLIIANVAVFTFTHGYRLIVFRSAEAQALFESGRISIEALINGGLAYPLLQYLGEFSIDRAIYHGQGWRFLTFQFLHAGKMHILMNMFTLYFFGPMIEDYLGRRKFLAFYLLCGIGGPVAYTLFYFAGIWGAAASASAPLIGASAGVFGVLIAAAHIAPDEKVDVYGLIPVKLKLVAWLLLAFAAYTVFAHGTNAGGEAAHLGGAAFGYVLIRHHEWLNPFEIGYRSGRRRLTYKVASPPG